MEARVIGLEKLGKHDVELVGGKNSSLGEMISHLSNAGVSVPGGFATTAAAYREFLDQSGLNARIQAELTQLNVDDVLALAETGAKIRKWIVDTPLTAALEQEIREAFAALSNRDSFNLSNSSSDLRSWLKTLTTLCPFILSSINPVTSANDFCWRIKYFPLFPPIAFVTVIMIPITTTARIVKIGLNTNIEINVTMIVKNDINA